MAIAIWWSVWPAIATSPANGRPTTARYASSKAWRPCPAESTSVPSMSHSTRSTRSGSALLEHHHAVAALLLGGVHRPVGVADQVGGRLVATSREHGADARGDPVAVAADGERGRQSRTQPLGRLERGHRGRDVLADRHELVPADSAERVADAYGLLKAVGHGGQQLVAGGVAELVVDDLEPVQVDEEERELGLVADGELQRMPEPVVQEAPVGKPRERV